MKRFIILAALLALPAAAFAQTTLTANLSGDVGTGFATIQIDGEMINYSILTSGLDSPNAAVMTDGTTTIDLGASFNAGSAVGSTSSADAPAVEASPGDFMVEVTNGTDTLSGVLEGGPVGTATVLYQPVVATVTGLGGTNFKTDVGMVNPSDSDVSVTIDYYAKSNSGQSGPNETTSLTIPANGQAFVVNFLESVWGISDGQGALVVTAGGEITSSARIYNDQVDAGLGTFGQYSQALAMSHAWSTGIVPFLSNTPANAGEGYRSNIGWFNPNAEAITVTFAAYAADGTMISENTVEAPGYQQQQVKVSDLVSGVNNYPEPFYLAYSSDGAVFIYGSVVDNVNGDASYLTAIPTSN